MKQIHWKGEAPPPGGGLEYKKGGDARREFWNWPLREINLGVARAFFTPKRD